MFVCVQGGGKWNEVKKKGRKKEKTCQMERNLLNSKKPITKPLAVEQVAGENYKAKTFFFFSFSVRNGTGSLKDRESQFFSLSISSCVPPLQKAICLRKKQKDTERDAHTSVWTNY